MKSIDSIPTSKIQRASKLIQTGAKVGVNYLKYYGDKLTKTEKEAKEKQQAAIDAERESWADAMNEHFNNWRKFLK